MNLDITLLDLISVFLVLLSYTITIVVYYVMFIRNKKDNINNKGDKIKWM